MANNSNESGAKHLTSLDFDLSNIWKQFEELQSQLPLKAKEIGEKTSAQMQKSMEESIQQINTTSLDNYTSGLVNTEKFKEAKREIDEIAKSYGKLAKSVVGYNEKTKLFTASITYDDEQGNKVVEYYKQVAQASEDSGNTQIVQWQKVKQTFEENYQAQEKLVKKQAELRKKEEERKNNLIKQTDDMIAKQKMFDKEMSNYKPSLVNKQVIADNTKYIKLLEELSLQLKNNKISAQEAQEKIAKYQRELSELGATADKTVGGLDNFLKVLSDKARWLLAFELITLTTKALKESFKIIKETEDAIVELQRVMNTDVGASTISKGLYQIASDYGRTFDEVQEVAVKFAQTGMEWDEVLIATKNTMLALNTAELDVTSSTEGLIAIQSQWKLGTEDLIKVIDKINITADNFTVTSEKLVAALQRVSGTARNAGLSLEQTIGIITTLSEATGRSGENIGTALNSLIAYTKKESSLKVFAGLSEELDETVRKFKSGSISIYELWKGLAKEINALSKEQQTYLLQAISQDTEYSEFAEELEREATDVTQRIQEVYKTAGTFRQNYFIALLNDLGIADEVLAKMGDATGYSLAENEKHMDTLTAKLNQLKTALAELAVQFGEAGALDLLKLLTELSIVVLKFTKDIGGLQTVISVLIPSLLLIKKVEWVGNIKKASNAVINLARNFSFATVKAKILTTTTATLSATINSLMLGVSLVVGAFSYFSNKMEEAKQQALESANSYKEQANGISELKKEYEELTKNMSSEELKNADLSKIKDELIKKYGIEKEALDALNQSREKGLQFLNDEEQKNIASAYYEISKEIEKAKKAMTNFDKLSTTVAPYKDISDWGLQLLESEGIKLERGLTVDNVPKITLVPSEKFDTLPDVKEKLQEISLTFKQNGEDAIFLDDIIRKITKSTEKYEEVYSKLGLEADYIVKASVGENNKLKELRESVSDTSSFETFKVAAIEAANGFKPLEKLIANATDNLFPQFSKEIEKSGENTKTLEVSKEYLEQLSKAFDDLNKSVDNYQKGLDAVYGAISEYNQNQYLSIDTIQNLTSLGWDYIKMLDFTAEGVKINEQYARELANSNQQAIEKVLKNAEAQSVLAVATKYLSGETNELKDGLTDLPSKFDITKASLEELSTAYVNGAISAQQFASVAFGEEFDKRKFNDFQKELTQVSKTFEGLRNSIGKDTIAWSNGAKNASKSISDAQKKQLEEQKKAIKERYQAEIDALKKVKDENDRIRKQEEYYRNRKNAEKSLEKAKTRSGVEYREQEEEALQSLEELDRKWQQQLEDWSIQDKIAELEKLRDAEIALIDAQINKIGNATTTIAKNTVETNSQANKKMAKNYDDDFLAPVYKKSTKTYENIFEKSGLYFGVATKEWLKSAELNSNQLYNVYNKNFISKMHTDMLGMQSQMVGLGRIGQLNSVPNLIHERYGYTNTTNYNNSTSNNNVYANIYGNNTAKSFGSSIFTKP